MIEARGLCVGRVLRGVSVELAEGALGVVGRNGAGKSTLLATLAGVLRPDAGAVRGLSGAVYLPESCPLDPQLPVAWLRRLAAGLPGWDADRAAALERTLGPVHLGRCGALSQGQRVRLGLWLTLSRRAPVYVLDDPFLGVDPEAKRAIEAELAALDAPLIVAAQDRAAIRRICTQILVLDQGAVAWAGRADDWRGQLPEES